MYRIKAWREQFETEKDERRMKGPMRWFRHPASNAAGVGDAILRRHPKGQCFRGIWTALLTLTSQQDEPYRGLLRRNDGSPHTAESLHLIYGGASLEDYREALVLFASPEMGWLIDDTAKPQAAKVLQMRPAEELPPIEEPSSYELAAERMIDRYIQADAPIDRIPDADEVARAIMERCEGRDMEATIGTLEANQEATIARIDPKMLMRLDRWIRSGLALAKPAPKVKAERGSVLALVRGEIAAGRMTEQEARAQGYEI